MSAIPGRGLSELEVEAECVVELRAQVGGKASDNGAESFHRDRADLFGLGLRVDGDACLGSGE